jgi:hypothetical protein
MMLDRVLIFGASEEQIEYREDLRLPESLVSSSKGNGGREETEDTSATVVVVSLVVLP